ncbi:MAG: hypothetical protein AAF899_06405 [Pseudomonadota bacterium]
MDLLESGEDRRKAGSTIITNQLPAYAQAMPPWTSPRVQAILDRPIQNAHRPQLDRRSLRKTRDAANEQYIARATGHR